MIKQGKLHHKQGAIREFTTTGIVLADESEIECDMVVYGTGFLKSYDALDRLLQGRLKIERVSRRKC